MTVRATLAVGGLIGCCLLHSTAYAEELFTARLDTVPIDFRTQDVTTGEGRVEASLDGDELTIDGSFTGLAGSATIAWLHVGSAVGARGPAVHALTVSPAVNGRVSGTVSLERRELDALHAGRLYVQIHSQPAPDGNLWGWLLPREE